MRKLIELEESPILVQCDNPQCDFTVPSETKSPFEDCSMFLNVPCPDCGWNLLTEKDYRTHMTFLRMVKFWNRWFSWLTIFSRKDAKPERYTAHAHNGLNIKKVDDEKTI